MTDTHIKMPDVIPVVRYAANGSDTEYAFPFPVFASEDVAVYLDGALQVSGYTIHDAGETAGGSVVFTAAPEPGVIVAIERRMPLERMTDFLEGGDLSARSLNNELDYLVAGLQQVARDQTGMLRYDLLEGPGPVILPGREARAGQALAFDEDGDLTLVAHGDTLAIPSYTQSGTGAVSRNLTNRIKELVSVRDFGAAGDGTTDDTTAFQNALAAHDCVFVPAGTYRTTSTIVLGERKTLYGVGQSSVIAADDDDFHVIEIRDGYATLKSLKMTGGDAGIKLYGVTGPCVQNTVRDLVIHGAKTGILLDGNDDTDKPCYWNYFAHVLIEAPILHGVHLTKTGAGDTPNANNFHHLRVYSHGVSMTGSGAYIEYGSHANTFTDCEFNVHGDATACVLLGAHANKTFLNGVYTESYNTVPNVKLENGSADSTIINLHAMSNGAAIWDLSGGAYVAYNSGYPNRNTFAKTTISDLNATLLRLDTVYVDAPGAATIDATIARTVHLVAATNGAIIMRLPAASDAAGSVYTFKKVDSSTNIVTVTAISGDGPDGRDMQLGGQYDFVTVQSNGAAWFILASNRMSGNTTYHDGSGTYDINMATDTYLLSAFAGAKTARLPPANAANAIGRTVTIKKTDVSGNAITVNVQGGGNIDGGTSVSLASQFHAVTVVSNGSQWYVLHKFS